MFVRFRRWLVLWLMLFGPSLPAELLKPGDFVAICGDSITEQKLYSLFVADYLLLCQPQRDLRAMQFGWSGETSWDFSGRIEHDVLPFHPTVATVCYGMNDGGYAPVDQARLARYRDALAQIVQRLKQGGVREIVLASPGVTDTGTFHRDAGWKVYNETLSAFRDAAREVAISPKVVFADIHQAMRDAMGKAKEKYGDAYHVAGSDGVHPSENGHLIMAFVLLKALGCSGDIGTITFDMSTGQATASEGHRVLHADRQSITLLSTRYPFCFFGDPADPAATRGMIDFIPFNAELNRFRLVINPPPASRLKITWGCATKEFAAEDLAKGINLAAEFLDNPFCPHFQAAQDAIREQQKMDTYLVKEFLHWTPGWSRLLPGNESSFRRLEASVPERARKAMDSARATIQPVEHALRIEAIP